jgi:hypothetical protein
MAETKKEREHKASRQHKNSNRYTALNKAPLRYAIIEMGDYDDVKVFETCLSRCCRKAVNVSPDIGKGITFKKEKADKWPEYKDAIENFEYSGSSTDEPEWWYISGHHAGFGDGNYYALTGDGGFFNDIYYEAHNKKIAGEVRNAIFMLTSRKDYAGANVPRTLLSQQVNPNPLYNKSPNTSTKGLFLIGCNTLSMLNIRSQLQTHFPKAIIFGYFYSKAPGYALLQAKHIRSIFKSVKKGRPSLFEDPDAYFQRYGKEDSLKEIVGKLSKRTKKRVLCVFHEGKLYLPEYVWGGGNTIWIHKWPIEKWAKTELVICPVPGKKNPFKYEQDGKFIVGLKHGRDARIYGNFKYSEFSKIMSPVKINTWLLLSLQNIRGVIDKSIIPIDVRNDGNEIEIYCQKIDKFDMNAKKYKKEGIFTDVRKVQRNGRTHFSLAVS